MKQFNIVVVGLGPGAEFIPITRYQSFMRYAKELEHNWIPLAARFRFLPDIHTMINYSKIQFTTCNGDMPYKTKKFRFGGRSNQVSF